MSGGEEGILRGLCPSTCRNEHSEERECGRGRVGGDWHSLCRGPHLGQGLDAHQVHKADPTHVEDESVEGDKGWNTGQHVAWLTGGLARGRRLTVGSWGAVGAEGNIGHAGAISRCLVVVGVSWGGVLEVLLELLQGDSLEGGGEGESQGSQTELGLAGAGQGTCRWRRIPELGPETPVEEESPNAPPSGGACSLVSHKADQVGTFHERRRSGSLLCSGKKSLGKS